MSTEGLEARAEALRDEVKEALIDLLADEDIDSPEANRTLALIMRIARGHNERNQYVARLTKLWNDWMAAENAARE